MARFSIPLRVLSAGSTLHGLKACAVLAAQATGAEIDLATDHGHNVRDAVLRGDAVADVVVIPEEMIAALAAGNLVRDRVGLGTVNIGGVVRAGAAMPRIATMQHLRGAIENAGSVLLTRAPTGDHLLAVIARLGLGETVSRKLLRFETASDLCRNLAQGDDAALGFAPETEIRASEGVAYAGGVPDAVQVALPYSAAAVTASNPSATARRFLQFLATPPARAAFSGSGIRGP